jgi:hypothetical protein
MAKVVKLLRKQADKAERAAMAATDNEVSEGLLALAKAYRSQAGVLKAKKKASKKSPVDLRDILGVDLQRNRRIFSPLVASKNYGPAHRKMSGAFCSYKDRLS